MNETENHLAAHTCPVEMYATKGLEPNWVFWKGVVKWRKERSDSWKMWICRLISAFSWTCETE